MKKLFMLVLTYSLLSAATNAATREQIVAALFNSVESWMGSDYQYGGFSKKGIDCSAFVAAVYKDVFKIDLPRSVKDQQLTGTEVTDKLQPGDLVFFKIDGSISHVGIFVFKDKFIHAASSGPETGVIKSSLKENYYQTRYAFARRVIKLPPYPTTAPKKLPSTLIDITVITGKNIYRDKIFNIQNRFNQQEKFYLGLHFSKPDNENYQILIERKSPPAEYRYIFKNVKQKIFIKELSLMKGIYQIRVFNKQIKLQLEKEIFID